MVKIRSISIPEELLLVLKRLADENRVSFSAELCRRVARTLTREEILVSGKEFFL